jgi:hypothetical protein
MPSHIFHVSLDEKESEIVAAVDKILRYVG